MSAPVVVARTRGLNRRRFSSNRPPTGHHATGATGEHRHLLLHVNRQPRFVHPVRGQHPEVTGENPQNPDVEQV